MGTFSFSRSKRLHGAAAFASVYDARVSHTRGPLKVFARPNGLAFARLGLSVSRKVGTAPRRNRIKRLIREEFRLFQHGWPRGYDIVIVVRPHQPLTLGEYQTLHSAMVIKLHAAWLKREATPPVPAHA